MMKDLQPGGVLNCKNFYILCKTMEVSKSPSLADGYVRLRGAEGKDILYGANAAGAGGRT